MLRQNSLLVITSAFTVRHIFTFKFRPLYNRNNNVPVVWFPHICRGILTLSAWNWEPGSLHLMGLIINVIWIGWTTTEVSENATFLHILSPDLIGLSDGN